MMGTPIAGWCINQKSDFFFEISWPISWFLEKLRRLHASQLTELDICESLRALARVDGDRGDLRAFEAAESMEVRLSSDVTTGYEKNDRIPRHSKSSKSNNHTNITKYQNIFFGKIYTRRCSIKGSNSIFGLSQVTTWMSFHGTAIVAWPLEPRC